MKFSPKSTAYLIILSIAITYTGPQTASALLSQKIAPCISRTLCSKDVACVNLKSAWPNGRRGVIHTIQFASEGSGENNANNERARDVLKKSYIDAVVEEKTAGLAEIDEENTTARIRKRDIFKKALRDLASLSLIDYKWRSAVFKKAEADRLEEEYVSKIMGEDYASYARPMDADDSRRGPLGNAERSAVQWLTKVIEEEGERARLIASSDGELVRPKDLPTTGPLSELERRAIQFLSEISDSEVERVRSGTLRPKDMKIPGPLGKAEAKAVLALDKIIESEKIRMERSRSMGDTLRPIDVPGPLGEFEKYVGDIIRAERQRVKDRERNDGKLVRPKDASMRSGLGDVERKAVEDWELLAKEENERFSSFKRFLSERRPADVDQDSALGIIESFTVKILNGPRLIGKVFNRVQELINSEPMDEKDRAELQRRFKEIEEKDKKLLKMSRDDSFGKQYLDDDDERLSP